MTNPTPHTPDVACALGEAVAALYFNDSSKYLGHLWNIVRHLGGEEAVELVSAGDGRAYHRYAINRNAAPATQPEPEKDSAQVAAAEREVCAQVCDEVADDLAAAVMRQGGTKEEGQSAGAAARLCAEELRSGAKPTGAA